MVETKWGTSLDKMKKWITIVCSIIGVLVIDLVTKHFLFEVEYFNLIPNVISIATNNGNTGAAFGIFSDSTIALVIVSIIMIAALFIFNYFVKTGSIFYSISFGFIVGGAIGNLIDRLTLGYVRDFIFLDFWPTFPIFNLADTFLCIGAVMMAIFILFFMGKKNSRQEDENKS